ncbi:hypothetical protein B0H14DRAFT_2599034 [Mycena olivaceomarginata]|nr:hypothetical protein B0H14DRAFT_2599034 [Mycena olivaceomarginata]
MARCMNHAAPETAVTAIHCGTEMEAQLPQRMQTSHLLRRENTLLRLEEEAGLWAAVYDVCGGFQPPYSQSQPWSQSQSQGYTELYSQGHSQDMCTDGVLTPLLMPQGSLLRIGDSDSPPLMQRSLSRSSPRPLLCTRGSPSHSHPPARLRHASPQGLGIGTPTPHVSPPTLTPSLTPAPIATPPVRTEPSIHPLLHTFSSLSALSSPLSEPPSSQPQWWWGSLLHRCRAHHRATSCANGFDEQVDVEAFLDGGAADVFIFL